MSLIQDALEKALSPEPEVPKAAAPTHEEPRLQSIKFYESTETPETVAQPARPKKKKIVAETLKNKIQNLSPQARLIALIGGFLVLSLILGPIWISPAKKSTPSSFALPTASVVAKTQTPITQKTIAQIKFTLTGITQADGIWLALINNQVVGEGDKMRENALVKSVTENTVTLEWQGKQIVLTL